MKTHAPSVYLGICHCGKRQHASRRAAKQYARQHSLFGLSVYECGDWVHLGHLPWAVKAGVSGREEIINKYDPSLRRNGDGRWEE